MKTILSGKAQQLSECVAFVTERCKADELNPNVKPMKEGTGVIIRCPLSFMLCYKFTIYEEANDLIIESIAGDCTILADPAPPRARSLFGFGNLFGFVYEKLCRMHEDRTLKDIHAEIEKQFGSC